MSQKNLISFLLCLLLFSQFAVNNNIAQLNNTRYFNERLVVNALRTIQSAQATYQATIGNGSYGSLSNLRQAGWIDEVLASGEKYGYSFALNKTDWTGGTTPPRYSVTGTPRTYRKNGRRSFYIDESGELRGADKNGALATAADPWIDWCLAYESEKCVISDLRNIHSAQMTFQATTGNGNFGNFKELSAAGLVGRMLASGAIHGYRYTLTSVVRTSTTPAFFKISAIPERYGATGTRSFYMDIDGVLRGADKNGEPADENDPPIDY